MIQTNAILQDHEGFMWFGMWTGSVVRFDGHSYDVYNYDPNDSTSVSRGSVQTLYEDGRQALWVGKASGLNRFDRETETFVRFEHDPARPTSISLGEVFALLEDRTGAFWVGTGSGLDRMDRATETFTHVFSDATPSGIHALLEDREGALWAASRGLLRIEPSTGTFTRFLPDSSQSEAVEEEAPDPNRIDALYEDRSGRFWIGTQTGGLYLFDRETGVFSRYRDDPARPQNIRAILDDPAGGLLLATSREGLVWFDPETRASVSYMYDGEDPYSLIGNRADALYRDRQGVFWIGLFWRGTDRFDRMQSVEYYGASTRAEDGLVYPHIAHVAESPDGTIWVLNGNQWIFGEPQVLTRIDPTVGKNVRKARFRHFRHDPSNPRSLAREGRPFVDASGTLWTGSRVLSRLDPGGEGTFVHFTHDVANERSLPKGKIMAMVEDRDGRLWLGVDYFGLARVDDREQGVFTRFPFGAETGYVNRLLVDSRGMIWVTTSDGLFRVDPDTGHHEGYLRESDNQNGLPGNKVYGIWERPQEPGVLWLGIYPYGLGRFVPETGAFRLYTTSDGLAGNSIQGVLGDEEGRIWMSRNGGLSRYDPDVDEFVNFDINDGFQEGSFNAWAYERGHSGRLYFGGTNGLNAFDPAQIRENRYPPQVALTGIRLGHEPLEPHPDGPLTQRLADTRTLTLTHDQNDLTLEFVGLHFRHPTQNQYTYILEGYDETWSDTTTLRQARYTGLPPGPYTFRVSASSADGVWSPEGVSLRIRVLPPWWRTAWAYSLYFLTLFTIVAAGYEWRTRRLRRHARELREMVRERSLELMAEQKKTEAQARRLLELEQARNRLYANISHEFRTPLTLIMGPLHDLLDGLHGSLRRPVRRQLRLMARNSARLLRLIDQLLALSKLDAGGLHLDVRRHNLVSFLRAIFLLFAPMAERRGVRLRFDADRAALPLRFDAERLEQVVSNLITNAFKFTPEGGEIGIWSGVVIHEGGPFAAIRITDTGCGIPPEELPFVFDRFHQVDEKTTGGTGGTGIGLALARELVDLHGGTIRAESRPGIGTTFTVLLPACDEAGEGRKGATVWSEEGPASAASSSRFEADGTPNEDMEEPQDIGCRQDLPTVLVVDDNADVRAYLHGHLVERYEVLEAADGLEGLETMRACRPDLAIVDVMMPRMNGVELCRSIRADEHLRQIPVILLTARATEEAELLGLDAGADDYVTKPFRADVLMARVENLIEIRRQLIQRFRSEVVLRPSDVVVTTDDAAFVERVRAVVESHLADEHFTVEWLADEVGLSPRQLQRRLRGLKQVSPGGLIRMMRLERAAQLLEGHAGPISEVAFQVGFRDPHYFSRLFRQTFGTSPSEFAARHPDA